jgi:hypothetical protein
MYPPINFTLDIPEQNTNANPGLDPQARTQPMIVLEQVLCLVYFCMFQVTGQSLF